MKHKMKIKELNPPQLLIVMFIVFIFMGTGLLLLPISNVDGLTFMEALFTATSAMTVTGLWVVDTAEAYTLFGEITILLLIQLGGLGIMTFAVLIFMALGKRIGIKQRLLVKQALNMTTLEGVVGLAKRLFLFSLTIEFIGAVFLALRWVPEMGWADGIYASIFHAISAFNNAGFSIWSNSLSDYVMDPVINIVISLLFIIGGLGFTVIFDLWKRKEFNDFSLHTKIMIAGTISINIFSVLMLLVLEFNNPQTLGSMPWFGKIQAAYFQAVTPRTAGFNTINTGQMEDDSLFFTIILMFIGGGSASTAGGIKLTTALTLVLGSVAFFQGKEHAVIHERSIRDHVVYRSLALTMGSACVIMISVFILNLTEKAPFLTVLFESVSAFGTVGLSMGLTGSLTDLGKLTIILTMLIGKLGPLTFAFAFAKQTPGIIRYPEEDIMTG